MKNVLILCVVVGACMLVTPIEVASVTGPFPAPDLSKCVYPTDLPHHSEMEHSCCPPYAPGTPIIDFAFPSADLPCHVRPAAHLVDQAYILKYSKALQLMKELPYDDPRSFSQQSKIHCAYCNGAYYANSTQVQVHYGWFFLPFHRWYLYFYERILGKLIGDDTFALPFWNWDAEPGMTLPAMYINPNSSLFDSNRDPCHQPPNIVNLKNEEKCEQGSVKENHAAIYTNIASGASTASLFHGGDCRYGSGVNINYESRAGTLETSPHDVVHSWTGSSKRRNRENMGALYSASRDPIFYSHHSNVDRMWTIWKDKLGRTDYQDPDLLNSKFVFYDENKQLVQVRAGDCYDTTKLRYKYQEVDIPWLTRGRSIKRAGIFRPKPVGYNFKDQSNNKQIKQLTAPVSVLVMRPKENKLKQQQAVVEEVLVIDGIEVDACTTSKFAIFINLPEANLSTTLACPHYGGSFVHLGQGEVGMKSDSKKASFMIGISETLEDLGVSEDKSIIVTLVPHYGKTPIKISSINIENDHK